jgi:hypothetical protein
MTYRCFNLNDKPIIVIKYYNCIGLVHKTKRDNYIIPLDSEYYYNIIIKEIPMSKFKIIKIRIQDSMIKSKIQIFHYDLALKILTK